MTDTESNNLIHGNFGQLQPINFGEYFIVQQLAKKITREARKHNLSYHQLQRAFVLSRKRLNLDPPKEKLKYIHIPTSGEITKFMDAIPKEHQIIFSVLIGSGLRIFELADLKIIDVDTSQNILYVRKGKGGKPRTVAFGNKLRNKLEAWLKDKKQTYLFESSRKKKWSKRAIQKMAEKASEKSGVHLSCHSFRHIYCSRLASGSLGIPALSESARATLMGHSKASTSVLQARYTSVALEQIKPQAVAILDSFND